MNITENNNMLNREFILNNGKKYDAKGCKIVNEPNNKLVFRNSKKAPLWSHIISLNYEGRKHIDANEEIKEAITTGAENTIIKKDGILVENDKDKDKEDR